MQQLRNVDQDDNAENSEKSEISRRGAADSCRLVQRVEKGQREGQKKRRAQVTNALAVFASARGRNVAGESMKTEGTARGKRERERGRQTHRKREERERELSDYLMEQHSDMKGGREKKNREKRRKRKIERIGGGKEKRRRGGKSEKRREKKYKREKHRMPSADIEY